MFHVQLEDKLPVYTNSLAIFYVLFPFSTVRYTLFWVLLIVTKLAFSYYIEVCLSFMLEAFIYFSAASLYMDMLSSIYAHK